MYSRKRTETDKMWQQSTDWQFWVEEGPWRPFSQHVSSRGLEEAWTALTLMSVPTGNGYMCRLVLKKV